MVAASAADDAFAILDTGSRFFERVTVATDNVLFITLMREAEMALRRNLSGWHPSIAAPVARTTGYAAFRDAVAARDGAAAEAILRAQHAVD
jgi:DNA-binding FadR family transcriptional regulator